MTLYELSLLTDSEIFVKRELLPFFPGQWYYESYHNYNNAPYHYHNVLDITAASYPGHSSPVLEVEID